MTQAAAGANTLPRLVFRGASQLAWSFLLPGAAAVLAERLLIPSQMDGGPEGVGAWLARINDAHPLLVCLTLFIACSTALHYWRERARAVFDGEPRVGGAIEAPTRPGFQLATRLSAAIVAALFLRFELAQLYRVDSPSMVPTLEAGDRLLVDELAYGVKIPFTTRRLGAHAPKRGDVIVFPGLPSEGTSKSLVKRVLGLPGDFVSLEGGQLLINNWVVPSCDVGPFATAAAGVIIRGRMVIEFLGGTAFLTVRAVNGAFDGYRVLPGEVFVMGDNRGLSRDSRYWNEGRGAGVSLGSIEGRVTRLIAGGRGAARVDLSQFLKPLAPRLREAGVDLRLTETRIGQCLSNAPAAAAATPPPPS